jgi:glycine dehydrogenase
MYAIYHGPEGLKNIAQRVNQSAHITARIFEHYGFSLLKNEKDTSSFFDTITVIDCDARKLSQ